MPDSRYEYIKKVGGGATCETFLIKHKDMNEYRILKKLPVSQQNKISFNVEVEILKNIKGKGIPVLYDIAVREDSLLIIEEFADGKSLKHLLEENNIDIISALWCIIDICHILSLLHQNGYIYLDIKPEHIILCQDTPYLIDYGNCMVSGSNDITMISEKFAAPEQFHSEPVGIYCILFRYLQYRCAFNRDLCSLFRFRYHPQTTVQTYRDMYVSFAGRTFFRYQIPDLSAGIMHETTGTFPLSGFIR